MGSLHGSWTEERVQLLRKLWAEGLSASQIARTLAGITRNAVIGKVHRLGLAGRVSPSRPVSQRRSRPPRPVRQRHSFKPLAASLQAEISAQKQFMAAIDRSRTLTPLLDGKGQPATALTINETSCKFPIGDPSAPDFGFCGRRPVGEGPYCPDHARLCYIASDVKKKRDASSARRLKEALGVITGGR